MSTQNSKLTLSIDWEDFGQLVCRDIHGIVTPPLKDIDRQTDIVLTLLDERGQKATFFVLGMLARFRPDLVRRIDDCGHEIAMHGDSHTPMHTLSREQAKADLVEAHELITGVTGKPVFGYRAPCFSINDENMHVLECLAELGLQYDSSIFPVKLSRYGIDDFNPDNCLYQLPNGMDLVELPLTTRTFLGRQIPVAGGGYMRIMPKMLLKRVFRQLVEDGVAPMIYMHPYEFDSHSINSASNFPQEPPISKWRIAKSNFKWNVFRKSVYSKIDYLLANYDFVTCKEKADDVRNDSKCKTILG